MVEMMAAVWDKTLVKATVDGKVALSVVGWVDGKAVWMDARWDRKKAGSWAGCLADDLVAVKVVSMAVLKAVGWVVQTVLMKADL